MSEEEIAANQFVSVSVVRQRLRLASVSPKLLDVYAEDGMTLDQLMAFTVNGDHERQEQVFERLAQSYNKEPHTIRRMLTEAAVRVSDKRAQFVGLDAYAEAGGVVLRDLFQGDDGGWLQDVSLLERLVADKLRVQSDAVSAEGWKWIDVAPDFPYGHTYGLRRLRGEQPALTAQEQATRDALEAELNGLEEAYRDSDELPEEVDERLGEIETAISAIDERPEIFNPDEIGCAAPLSALMHQVTSRSSVDMFAPNTNGRLKRGSMTRPRLMPAWRERSAYSMALPPAQRPRSSRTKTTA